MRIASQSLVGWIALGVSCCFGAEVGHDAAWAKAGADQGLRLAYERAVYAFEDSGHGTYRGANPLQQFTLDFDNQKVRLNHPNGSVSFHLTVYGYGDSRRTTAAIRTCKMIR